MSKCNDERGSANEPKGCGEASAEQAVAKTIHAKLVMAASVRETIGFVIFGRPRRPIERIEWPGWEMKNAGRSTPNDRRNS